MLSALMCSMWGIHPFLSPLSLYLKGRKPVAGNILPQRKISARIFIFLKCSPLLTCKFGSANAGSLPLFCTRVRGKITPDRRGPSQSRDSTPLMGRFSPVLQQEHFRNISPPSPCFSQQQQTSSCLSQQPVLGRTSSFVRNPGKNTRGDSKLA